MKVLFMSGLPKETLEMDRLLEPGALFLPKPFDGSTLIQTIHEALQMPRSNPSVETSPAEPHHHLAKEVSTMHATLSALAQAVQHLAQQLNVQPRDERLLKPPAHSKRRRFRMRRRIFLNPREEDHP